MLREAICLGLPDLEKESRKIGHFINSSHRHHVLTMDDVMAHPEIDAVVKEAYSLFRGDAKIADQAAFDRLSAKWKADWAGRSPGPQASSFAHETPGWHLERSHEFEKAGDIGAAIKAVRSAIRLAPGRAALHRRLGNLLLEAGRMEEAEAAQLRAIALDDTSPWSYSGLSLVLERLGRTDEAIAAIEQAIGFRPSHAYFHHRLGNLLRKAQRLDDAAAAERRAIALDPGVPSFYSGLSMILEQLGQTAEAVAAIEGAVALLPDQPHLYFHLGHLLLKMDRIEEAEAAERQAIALDDTSPQYHTGLSLALERLGRIDEAIAGIERAMKLGPCPTYLYCRLDGLLAKSGRFQKAELIQKRAINVLRGKLEAKDRTVLPSDTYALRAMLAAQAWGKDLAALLAREGTRGGKDDQEWPFGQTVPKYEKVSFAPTAAKGPRPLLSVMLPVYNVQRADWLADGIESVLAQNPDPGRTEIVVLDDASRNTAAKDTAERYGSRVRYRRNSKNLGLIGNHNMCIEAAAGDFVHILHQDDRIEPGFYDALLEPLSRDRTLVAAFANFRYIDEASDAMHRQARERPEAGKLENWLPRLAQGQAIAVSSLVVRRSSYVGLGGFSPSLVFAFDWDMWGRLANLGPIWYEPRCLASFRMHLRSATYSIAPVNRLVDEMRAVLRMVGALPAGRRPQVARASFTPLFLKYWTMLSDATALAESDRKGLENFLERTPAEDPSERALT